MSTHISPRMFERSRLALIASATLGLAGIAFLGPFQPAAARDLLQPEPKWTVSEDFAKTKKARINLSGAACAPTSPPLTSCLIVNDDKKYAQTFTIDGTTLRPARVVRLMPEDIDGDPDAEAAAYDDGYFYVTGSHGRPRHHPEAENPASYTLFRYPVDEHTRQPDFVSEEDVKGLETTGRLRGVLKTLPPTAGKYDKPLEEGGINIEGLAVRNGRIYFGLRGPSLDKRAFVISVDRDAIFTDDKPLHARSHHLKLGKHTGIRDLAKVRNGLLVLSGPVNDQAVKPAISLWGDDGELRKLAELDISSAGKGAKAETLLVLQDDDSGPLRVLVMFDGPENGSPLEYVLKR
ncbi:DUF3616 domain-containing protein [Rhodopseudomonas palustris]|uniref:DUF3616 domain-containing protein n=1 Tax=Rhodopseudomonas palustris TaxID=1076 RepID=UPI0020CC2940|nr:DUF3616 domain-containing protein [Rhodopseudomonas palustris]MCP9625791.1 DUF3616 domain-containing protein [Rhodopseudomonas palustris]